MQKMDKNALITDKWYINHRDIIEKRCCFAFVMTRFIASGGDDSFSV